MAAASGSEETAAASGGAHPRRWTVMEVIEWSGPYLQEKGVAQGRLDAEHLLASVLGVRRLDLYLRFDQPLELRDLAAYKPLLRRRAAREPLQYVLGSAPFRTLDLAVDPRVAIPRPETEHMIDALADAAAPTGPFKAALDVGTGSGAIAISLLAEGLAQSVIATDASVEALDVARANAEVCGHPAVEFRQGAGTQAAAPGAFDLILSNPPYLSEAGWRRTEPEVRLWEPRAAMVGGPRGLGVLRALAAGLGEVLRPGGWAGFEVGDGQAGDVVAMLRGTGLAETVSVRDDLAGTPRYVFMRRDAGPAARQTSNRGSPHADSAVRTGAGA